MNSIDLKVAKVHPDARLPEYKTPGAACFDILVLVEGAPITIEPGQAVSFRTGLAFEIPEGWRLDIVSRSGLWFNKKVRVGHGRGTIDCDYRGEVMVSLENAGTEPFVVKNRERIAQGEINKVTRAHFIVCEQSELSETERGAGGFGSTGV